MMNFMLNITPKKIKTDMKKDEKYLLLKGFEALNKKIKSQKPKIQNRTKTNKKAYVDQLEKNMRKLSWQNI